MNGVKNRVYEGKTNQICISYGESERIRFARRVNWEGNLRVIY